MGSKKKKGGRPRKTYPTKKAARDAAPKGGSPYKVKGGWRISKK